MVCRETGLEVGALVYEVEGGLGRLGSLAAWLQQDVVKVEHSSHRPIDGILAFGEGLALPAESEYEDPETLMLLQQKDQEIKKMQLMLEQMQQKLKASN